MKASLTLEAWKALLWRRRTMGWSILWLQADCQQRFLQQGERATPPSPDPPPIPFCLFLMSHATTRALRDWIELCNGCRSEDSAEAWNFLFAP
jgi:hypothetical protein